MGEISPRVWEIKTTGSETKTSVSETKTLFLGPFVGDITRSSVKIWLNIQSAAAKDQDIYVTLEAVKQGPRNDAERLRETRRKNL